jgi:hypothetical protein
MHRAEDASTTQCTYQYIPRLDVLAYFASELCSWKPQLRYSRLATCGTDTHQQYSTWITGLYAFPVPGGPVSTVYHQTAQPRAIHTGDTGCHTCYVNPKLPPCLPAFHHTLTSLSASTCVYRRSAPQCLTALCMAARITRLPTPWPRMFSATTTFSR